MRKRMQEGSWARRTGFVLTLALSLGALTGCDELLEVELPAQLGDDAVEDPAGATTLVNSVIGQFEKGWNWKVARSFTSRSTFRSAKAPRATQARSLSASRIWLCPVGARKRSRASSFAG